MTKGTNKEVAISVKNVHKEFVLPQSKNTSFKHSFVNIVKKNNKVTQKVLNGVSFEVNKGDFFGIVGRNGSGKSTLLKMLAGVYKPTSGDIQINGGLTPFIELGVGFNPELSGRDNVYLNGALLGFNRTQMDEMYDEIVEFAELEPFMDQKLKNYSSGMQVRLAFSIAIKAKNEILIFDEVLAVGDEAFQRKCLDVFDQYKAEGQTVILVTHSMDTVKNYCNRAILISDGKILSKGRPGEVADFYTRLNQNSIDKERSASNLRINQGSNIKIQLKNINNIKKTSFSVGETARINISWEKNKEIGAVWVDMYKKSGEHVANFISSRDSKRVISSSRASLDIELLVTPGAYYLDVGLWDSNLERKLGALYSGEEFIVLDDWSMTSKRFGGLVNINSKWG